ncbi:hypothetical protein [Pantoea agglomerans]
MKHDYIIFGAGHDGSILTLEHFCTELPILPYPCTFNKSDEVQPIKLELFDVFQAEVGGKQYNVASNDGVQISRVAKVVSERKPRPTNS